MSEVHETIGNVNHSAQEPHPQEQDEKSSRSEIERESADPKSALELFSPATRDWFLGAFERPTLAQAGAWEAISQGQHAVIVAPTGSGKTLAAFLWAIDQLASTQLDLTDPTERCKILYVSPLKALAADVERNLRSPLRGIEQATMRRGEMPREILVGTRTGDTPASERRKFAKTPPDIMITTPESLFLMLTSGARAGLAGVETVIIDEIHYVAGTKRGAHLAISLERLDKLLKAPVRRIGLSATVEPVSAVAEYLAGGRPLTDGGRKTSIVKPRIDKTFQIDVTVPLPDMSDLSSAPLPAGAPHPEADAISMQSERRASIWPHVEEEIVDLIEDHTSTLVFTNARRGAERLTSRLNEIVAERSGEDVPPPGERHAAQVQAQSGASAGVAPTVARAHHGSMSRAERTRTENDLKNGLLPAVVSTSSLELGIDMGSIDLVIQVGPPPSVSSGLQRVGRAGHQVGAVSHGIIFPLHRGELPATAVIAQRMREGVIETFHRVHNPLDVLAQQIVAMLAVDEWQVEDLSRLVRYAAPFSQLGDGSLQAVLDMLAGRYPSEDFGELRARIVWDRVTNTLSGRPGALRLATTSGGTIPDRGLYGVFLVDDAAPTDFAAESAQDALSIDTTSGTAKRTSARTTRLRGGKRVGELDEEMVYESRVGDVFTLGSSTWRIEEITPDRVLVSPAPGVPGRLPFWKGDSLGRPVELGKAIGRWLRTTVHTRDEDPTWTGLNQFARDNLARYIDEQLEATGVLPSDTSIVVERFRDELGDWRIVIHSPHGSRVHGPWALVIGDRIREKYGVDASVMHMDDGIVLRIPNTDDPVAFSDPFALDAETLETASVTVQDLLIAPEDVARVVREQVSDSSLFGARFREAAARALLLPKARPDKRQPLWQQRQRSAQLLSVAADFPDFPIVLEAVRECLQDDFDVPALKELMAAVANNQVRVVEIETQSPSPFAQSLLFGYTAQYIYDGDAPLAERRAAALTLDPALLAELLGQEGGGDLADLLDPAAITQTAREIGAFTPERAPKTAEHVWELLHRMGPQTLADVARRIALTMDDSDATEQKSVELAENFLHTLERTRRVINVRIAGVPAEHSLQWAAIEDAGRLRDALGVALPVGVPEAFTDVVPDPLGDLIRRHARTHVPFTAQSLADRFGLGVAVVHDSLRTLVSRGILISGRLLPTELGGTGAEFCDAEVMRVLRRRSLAALRAEVEPVTPSTLGTFLPHWQKIGQLRGIDGVYQAIEQLSGAPIPLSALESQILPARVTNYKPAFLDELTTSGEVLWFGHRALPGPKGGKDALISLHLRDGAELTLPSVTKLSDHDELAGSENHRRVLDALTLGGGFFLPRLSADLDLNSVEVSQILWDLVWAGLITNDSLTPLRALLGSVGSAPSSRSTKQPRAGRSRFGSLGRPLTVATPPNALHAGRWSALPERDSDPTRRLHAAATVLMDRYGVVTRNVATVEELEQPFTQLYRVLSTAESLGKVRRGYFIEKLGGSQFAHDGAVDLLRSIEADVSNANERKIYTAQLLAASDPANPYGGMLPWPDHADPDLAHRPGRKAGASVVLVNGELALYVEKGGKTLLTFAPDVDKLSAAAHALTAAIDKGQLPKLYFSKIDALPALSYVRATSGTAPLDALRSAGFSVTPSGVRYQARPRSYSGGARA